MLPLIPSYVIIFFAFLNVLILLIWLYRAHSWTSIALMVPMLYLIFIYAFIDNLDLPEAQKFGRYGFVVLLFCLAIVNAVYARIIGGKHNGN